MPNGPKNAVANRELTSELKDKWDLDLTTIDNLQKMIEENGGLFIIRGGFATEAFCGGHLTRAHNDIDAHFLNSTNLSEDKVFNIVEKVLKNEKTNWQLYKRSPEKIEFREKEDERPFFDRRRIELYISKDVFVNPERKKLIYNDSREIEVNAPEFYDFVAGKVKKLFLVNDKPEEAERETNLSDYTDLKRLMEIPNYDPVKAIKALEHKLKNYSDPGSGAIREYNYVIDLLSQL